MDLRELKKEVHELANIDENLKKFQENWLRPLRTNTNSHLPFIKKLDTETKLQLNRKLAKLQEDISKIKQGQMTNEKLTHYSRYLIEMRLTHLQGDNSKSEIITNRLLNDDFLNMRQTISEVKGFEESVQKLNQQYNEINELLQKRLSLEETLFFMELPHKLYLRNLMKTSQKQKVIIRNMGHHFVSIVKENKKSHRL